MRAKNLFVLFFVLLLSVSFINCGGEKTEKEKALELAESMYNFMKSDEAKKMAEEGNFEEMLAKMETLAQDAGFKDWKEAESVLEKYEDDPDLNEWKQKIESLEDTM